MGLASLRRLDLSQTAITNLPVRGLSELETLELIETRTLKEIPSVYNYKVNKSLHQFPTIRVYIHLLQRSIDEDRSILHYKLESYNKNIRVL
jgi:hypothetical protein